MSPARVLVPAEMAGRELARRRVAMALLTLLPLAFYEASAHHSSRAPVIGGIAMAFSIAGAAIFAALTARPVDQRLVLAGYRPYELLLGRLLLLELFGLGVAALFSVVMVLGTGPADAGALVGGVVLVAIASVPFGLAVGTLAPHELEGVLILIGVVGVQLTLESGQTLAKLLPFWGAERLIEHSLDPTIPLQAAIGVELLYGTGLFMLGAFLMWRRAPEINSWGLSKTAGEPRRMR
jgi:hypothetical protein